MARGLHGPCALWNSKLSGSPWYGKTLDGAHCVRNLWRGALQGAWLGFSVLMVPQFTDIHAKTAGRALWRVLASSPVLEPKQGVTLPPWKTARAVHLAHLSRLLREQSYPVSADAREVATCTEGRLTGCSGLGMSFASPTLLAGAAPAGSTIVSGCRLT